VLTALLMSAALLAQDTSPLPDSTQVSPAAVTVDQYHGSYGQTDRALSYDSGIWSAYRAKESEVGSLEGSWTVADTGGRKLLGLVLRSDNVVSGRIEGAWRSMLASFGLNNSGFVSDVSLTGHDLEVNYFVGKARSPTILHLHKDDDGLWRGTMLDPAGQKTAVTMAKERAGS